MASKGSNPEAPKPETGNHQGLKSIVIKGAVGAVTLAGTTAIPLMVQKFLSPAPPVPAVQASPAQESPDQSHLMQVGTDEQVGTDDEKPGNRKGQKKNKN